MRSVRIRAMSTSSFASSSKLGRIRPSEATSKVKVLLFPNLSQV